MSSVYEVYTTEEFDRDFGELDHSIKLQVEKEVDQLRMNPYVGKPLGYSFFREKKIKKFRIYYLIYDEYVVVFVIALSEKKDQQGVIDAIRKQIPQYREEIKKKLPFSSKA